MRGITSSRARSGAALTFVFVAGSLTCAMMLNELLVLRKSET